MSSFMQGSSSYTRTRFFLAFLYSALILGGSLNEQALGVNILNLTNFYFKDGNTYSTENLLKPMLK
jgi:hypothetical protein